MGNRIYKAKRSWSGSLWRSHFWSGSRCCPKWGSWTILRPCLRLRGEWRLTMVWCGVRRTLHQRIAFEREWSVEEKMSLYQLIYIYTLTFGHKFWVVMEKKKITDRSGGNAASFEGWPGSALKLGWGLDWFTSWGECSGQDPGKTGEMTLREPLGVPWMSWRRWLGRRKARLL